MEVSSNTAENCGRIEILISKIDLQFQRITLEEEKAFRHLKNLLHDQSCFFTSRILPRSVAAALNDFDPNDSTFPNICNFLTQLIPIVASHIDSAGMEPTCRFVPYRFFLLLNECIGDIVKDTIFDINRLLLDDAASTVELSMSPPDSPTRAALPDSTTNSDDY